MEFLSLIRKAQFLFAKKITFSLKKITFSLNPSSKVVTMEEALDGVKVDRIGNLVK